MTVQNQTSGDLTADRRAQYARQYAAAGDLAAAIDIIAQALELAPGHLPFLALQGEWLEKSGRLAEAIDLWRKLLRLDPDDHFAAHLRLANLGVTVIPDAPPAAYVESLFDDFAPRFETSLVKRLEYDAPQRLASAIFAVLPPDERTFRHAIDLGCGTGLMGEHLRRTTSFLEGIDLSAGMLKVAAAKRIYDRLEKGDITSAALTPSREAIRADLTVAADVYSYLGDLSRAFEMAGCLLEPSGLFAFTVEAHDGPEDYVLQPSLRYAHSETYLRDALCECAFDVLSMEAEFLRMDGKVRIGGLFVVARKSGTAPQIQLPVIAIPEENENIALGGPALAH